MESKISIIIPVYNVEKYLEKCIDSVINQTYKNLEIILIDDGSKDKSSKICDIYAKKDNRIVVIHNQNMGLSGARNSGLDIATGEYVTFIDSDDYISSLYIEKLYKPISMGICDISICSYKKVDEKDNIMFSNKNINSRTIILSTQEAVDMQYYMGNKSISFITAWAKLVPLKYYDDIRFPLGVIHEDEFTTYKLYIKASKIAYISTPMYYYLQRKGSIMSKTYSNRNLVFIDAFLEKIKFLEDNNLDCSDTISRFYALLYQAMYNIKKYRLDYDLDIIKNIISELNKKNYTINSFYSIRKRFYEKYLSRIFYNHIKFW